MRSRFPRLAPALAVFVAAVPLGCDGELSEILDDIDTVYAEEFDQETVGNAEFGIDGINEDCTDDDPDDATTFTRREDDDGTQYCMIAIDWTGLLVSMAEVREGIQEGLDESGAPDGVTADEVDVTFKDVTISELEIRLVKESETGEEEVLSFDDVTYYLANILVADVGDLVQIAWPDAADPARGPDSPAVDVVGDEATEGNDVINYMNDAYAAQEDVKVDGHAELEFIFVTAEDLLAMNGASLKIDFKVNITGEGSVGFTDSFASPDP